MEFSKAIRLKKMVNKFNQRRCEEGFAAIHFSCVMFTIGHWSVDLHLDRKGCFFSAEMKEFFEFCRNNGLMLFVGSNQVSPVLYLQ